MNPHELDQSTWTSSRYLKLNIPHTELLIMTSSPKLAPPEAFFISHLDPSCHSGRLIAILLPLFHTPYPIHQKILLALHLKYIHIQNLTISHHFYCSSNPSLIFPHLAHCNADLFASTPLPYSLFSTKQPEGSFYSIPVLEASSGFPFHTEQKPSSHNRL